MAGPAACGAVTPDEESAVAFFIEELCGGVADGRYSAGLAERLAPVLQRLEVWETRCSSTNQRMAVQEMRRLIGGTRARGDLLLLRGLLATALARGPDVRVVDSRGGFIIAAHRVSNGAPEARRLFDQGLKDSESPWLAAEFAQLAFAVRDAQAVRSADAVLRRLEQKQLLDEGTRTWAVSCRSPPATHARQSRRCRRKRPVFPWRPPPGRHDGGVSCVMVVDRLRRTPARARLPALRRLREARTTGRGGVRQSAADPIRLPLCAARR